ncbi:hypothetical protein J5N97_013886 [Dioscorea zingiberensis]|uniref:WEB family protein n=1 Tax=Dioscorea zingiberensis TaxID=325984 RepID=A0A9D5CSX0_9LILI|nr:hypothetical protein J5N97_013886 [Dioscorea zingiberensis]
MNPPPLLENSDKESGRAMIETSAPFLSVKDAVILFEGVSNPRRSLHEDSEKDQCFEEVAIMEVKEQTAQVEKDLILKESETVAVLKELEITQSIIKDLKLKLQKEATNVRDVPKVYSDSKKVHPVTDYEEHCPRIPENQVDLVRPNMSAKHSPKVNASRTTNGLAGIPASIQLLNSKIQTEKELLEVTRQNLSANTAKVLSLEEDLNQITLKLQLVRNVDGKQPCLDPSDISKKIEELKLEVKISKLMTEAAKSKVSKLTTEIEQTKARIKTAEIRQHAARKIEAAARAAKVAALANIKALSNGDNLSSNLQTPSMITLPVEDYVLLLRKARQVDELLRRNIKADQSKHEFRTERTEIVNIRKLTVEEAFRKWRLEHVQKQHSLQNTKFKNPSPSHPRRDSMMLDVNRQNLVTDSPSNAVITGSMSSGDKIAANKNNLKPKVTLVQLLAEEKSVGSQPIMGNGQVCKKFSAKRKKIRILGLLSWMIKTRTRTRTMGTRRRRIRRRSWFAFSC